MNPFKPCLCAAVLGVGFVAAGQAALLEYRGRLQVAGEPFTGEGQFMFRIVDAAGRPVWASGEAPRFQATNSPLGTVRAAVSNGFYTVRLGDTRAGMPALEADMLRASAGLALETWFHDGRRGWDRAGQPVALATVMNTAEGAALTAGQAESVLRELREIRSLLGRPEPPPAAATPVRSRMTERVMVTAPEGNSASMGAADAPAVLVEFTDFQCQYCKRFQATTLPGLVSNYVQSGKLRIVSRNLAMPFHSGAEPAAVAAVCAQAQGRYWEMRERLFAWSGPMTKTNLLALGSGLRLDLEKFAQCLEEPASLAQVKRDAQDAEGVGITGTPSFVLGKSGGGKVTGLLIEGAKPLAVFETELKRLLSPAGTTNP